MDTKPCALQVAGRPVAMINLPHNPSSEAGQPDCHAPFRTLFNQSGLRNRFRRPASLPAVMESGRASIQCLYARASTTVKRVNHTSPRQFHD